MAFQKALKDLKFSNRNKEREEETYLGDKSIKDNVGLVGSYGKVNTDSDQSECNFVNNGEDVENFVQKDKVNEKGSDAIKDDETSKSNNVSYANMVKNDEVPKNLNYIPTMCSASSLGKPMMMDTMTANMCYKGVGNLEYARVLVEMDTEKELKKEIEIQYRDHNNNIKGRKKVKVVYDWKLPACTICKVFGHDDRQCKK
uniref:ATPase, F1/V1/A1 complex, alpha/beta subunit, zinc knuckle CX2CX4HX4C n=1 Tax=Tanacetum cinerariifolium TaxID=118510 RepID=A0A6L2JZS6_TANCI|nr:ATPase, F1/V1/A1 complex, alpha/beta subunit, zinc knuckle CX2CX4HX4C [Tanacetum cinerariifolium]